MSSDPIADRRRIGSRDDARRLGRGIFPAILIDQSCGVKSKQSSPRDADAAARDDDQDERAGGEAWTVNDDALAGLPKLFEKLDKGAGLASRAGFDPHLGQRGPQRNGEKQNGAKSAEPHWDILIERTDPGVNVQFRGVGLRGA